MISFLTKKIKSSDKTTSVLTIRVDHNFNKIINEISEKRGLPKSVIIRNYLELARYILIDHNSVKSLNDNDLIMFKRSFFKRSVEELDEVQQIERGMELAQFINDIARLQNQVDNLNFKLELCQHYGFFPKFIDKQNFILFSKKFGPQNAKIFGGVGAIFTQGN